VWLLTDLLQKSMKELLVAANKVHAPSAAKPARPRTRAAANKGAVKAAHKKAS
jgi:ribosomal protein L12E/L44/L45/RPP1/RPP2